MLALTIPAAVSTVLATLATTGHLTLWHVALGNLVSGTMWTTEMSTRRRMVGEVAGRHRFVPAIALDSATNAATRMVAPCWAARLRVAGHEGRLQPHRPGAVRRRLRARGLVHHQLTRQLVSSAFGPRSSKACLRLDQAHILLVWGITVVTNAFAFAYSGLVAPLGLGEFHVSPALVGVWRRPNPSVRWMAGR